MSEKTGPDRGPGGQSVSGTGLPESGRQARASALGFVKDSGKNLETRGLVVIAEKLGLLAQALEEGDSSVPELAHAIEQAKEIVAELLLETPCQTRILHLLSKIAKDVRSNAAMLSATDDVAEAVMTTLSQTSPPG